MRPPISEDPSPRPPSGEHHRAPRQERSRRTLERIEAAALELLEEGGVGAVTVQAVVDRAGSSVGSFYARFPGKEELLRYLEERVWTAAEEQWDRARAGSGWETLPVEGIVRGVVSLLARTTREEAARRLAFGSRDGGSGTGGAASFHRHVLADVSGLLLDSDDLPEVARSRIELGYWMVVGTLRLLHAPGSPAAPAAPDRELSGELAAAYLAYLGAGERPDPETPSAPREPDFFDVWG